MTNPRVLHLATSLGGGAGIAARRIVQAQVDQGMNSHLSAANQSGAVLARHESILPKSQVAKYSSKAVTLLQTKVLQNSELLVTPISINTIKNLTKHIQDIDVIHLHAFYNLLDIEVLSELSQIVPIAITLHDQRFFTGGCHYSGECEGYKFTCSRCPQVRPFLNHVPRAQLTKSMRTIKDMKKVQMISPSQWLASLAEQSTALSSKSIVAISNPVPNVFQPAQKKRSKNEQTLKIGFVSENLSNPYKGIQVLIDALERLPLSFQAEVKFIGRGLTPQVKHVIPISREHISDSASMAKAIQGCDVIVVPSLQDNSPSVISESLMCGVPVIGSKVGGISELLLEFDLPSFEKEKSEQLSQILEKFQPLEMEHSIQKKIREKFSPESSARRHLKIYKELIS
jgi:glycosyltransferase involved in cell wall biosynthesis